MLRFLWGELRHRGGRTLALFVGIVVAAAGFTALTGAVRASRLQVVGTVQHNFRSSYDVLVRPQDSATALERSRGLVRGSYLSGIFGGITLDQYRTISQIPGIEVAAPIAMLGYALQDAAVPVDLTELVSPGMRALFRVTVSRSTDRGTLRFPNQQSFYVYVTPRPLAAPRTISAGDSAFGPKETLSSGATVIVCPIPMDAAVSNPFDPKARGSNDCWSTVSGLGGAGSRYGVPLGHVAAVVHWPFPFLVAAVDPAAESQLAGVKQAVVQGRYLRAGDAPATVQDEGGSVLRVPVIASARPYTDDTDQVTVQRLPTAAADSFVTGKTPKQVETLIRTSSATTVLTRDLTTADAYQQLLSQLTGAGSSFIDTYWTTGPTSYRVQGNRVVTPEAVRNPLSVWESGFQATGWVVLPADAQSTGFRSLTAHVGSTQGQVLRLPTLHAVGTFDPARLPGLNPLTRLPLQTYNPPQAAPGDDRTKQLLHGQDLLPNGNIAGYLQPPPLMLTTLGSIPAFTNRQTWGQDTTAAAPISVVRVRVAGVTGPDPLSLARIRQVAQEITERTGLAVDITAGSSPTPITVQLPAGDHGRPALTLIERWVEKRVAVSIITAVDRKSLALFALIFVVCGLFVANAATASVRIRRRELGVLSCLGWPARRLFASVILELAVVGLAGGLVGTAVAWPLAQLAGLTPSPLLAALAVPASVVLAAAAGVLPARRAALSSPIDAVRPAVTTPGTSARAVRTVLGLAARQVRRTPGRTAVGAIALAVGVAGLTLLLSITALFHGTVVGSLLGDAISVQVRATDYAAVAVIVALGASAVADVLYIDIRDRAPELATLVTGGWDDRALLRLVTAHGAIVGLVGGLVGAGAGLAAVARLGGHPLNALPIAAACALAGPLLAAIASLVPAVLLAKQPVAALTAEEA